jgi:hypothetical protein
MDVGGVAGQASTSYSESVGNAVVKVESRDPRRIRDAGLVRH